jgi:hypothetical protein
VDVISSSWVEEGREQDDDKREQEAEEKKKKKKKKKKRMLKPQLSLRDDRDEVLVNERVS